MRPWLPAVLLLALMPTADFPYGGGPDQTRYSRLTEINRDNVASLKVAWTYDTGDAFDGSACCTPRRRVFGSLPWMPPPAC